MNIFKDIVVECPYEIPTGKHMFYDNGIKEVDFTNAKLICEKFFIERSYECFLKDIYYHGWNFYFKTFNGNYIKVVKGGCLNTFNIEIIDKKTLDEIIFYYNNDKNFKLIDENYKYDIDEI